MIFRKKSEIEKALGSLFQNKYWGQKKRKKKNKDKSKKRGLLSRLFLRSKRLSDELNAKDYQDIELELRRAGYRKKRGFWKRLFSSKKDLEKDKYDEIDLELRREEYRKRNKKGFFKRLFLTNKNKEKYNATDFELQSSKYQKKKGFWKRFFSKNTKTDEGLYEEFDQDLQDYHSLASPKKRFFSTLFSSKERGVEVDSYDNIQNSSLAQELEKERSLRKDLEINEYIKAIEFERYRRKSIEDEILQRKQLETVLLQQDQLLHTPDSPKPHQDISLSPKSVPLTTNQQNVSRPATEDHAYKEYNQELFENIKDRNNENHNHNHNHNDNSQPIDNEDVAPGRIEHYIEGLEGTKWQILRSVLKILMIIVSAILALLMIIYIYFSIDMPDLSVLRDDIHDLRYVNIKDQDGSPIYKRKNLQKKTLRYVEYQQLSPYLIDAIIATQDKNFFKHKAIDWKASVRALINNIISFEFKQTGYTITQQVVNMKFNLNKTGIRTSIQKIFLSFIIEAKFTKQEIFEIYVNNIIFNGGIVGISNASKILFNKKVKKLNLMESVILTSFMNVNNYIDSDIKVSHAGKARRTLINMYRSHYISSDERLINDHLVDRWFIAQDLNFNDNAKFFIDFILNDLENKVSYNHNQSYEIKTSFNKKIYERINSILHNIKQSYIDIRKVPRISIVVMKPNGAILSILGNNNYIESSYNGTIKEIIEGEEVFSIFSYIKAIENGYLPNSMMKKTNINSDKDLSLKESFVEYNRDVINYVVRDISRKKIIDLANRMGIIKKFQKSQNKPLKAKVSLLELVVAYAHVMNKGFQLHPFSVMEITDNTGNMLYQKPDKKEKKIMNDQTLLITKFLLRYNAEQMFENKYEGSISNNIYAHRFKSNKGVNDVFIGFNDDFIVGIFFDNREIYQRKDSQRLDIENLGYRILQEYSDN